MLHGDFKPATGNKALSKVNKSMLPDIVIYLKEVIRVDWAEINFIIGSNPDELIEIKFERSPDADIGLKPYMNTLISSNETISQFNLKRVLNFWGHTDAKYMYFLLMPPWHRQKVSEVYEQILLKEQMEEDKEDKKKDDKKVKLYSEDIEI